MDESKKKRMLSPERLERMDSEALMARLNLSGDETLVDAGAGPGAFAFRFAKELPQGRVFAVDIDTALLAGIAAQAEAEDITNIVTVEAEKLDIPAASADIVFCCTVLHEVAKKEAFLSDYYRLLKHGGRIFIVEFVSGRRSMDPSDRGMRAFIPPEQTECLLATAGFTAISSENINPLIYLTIASKP